MTMNLRSPEKVLAREASYYFAREHYPAARTWAILETTQALQASYLMTQGILPEHIYAGSDQWTTSQHLSNFTRHLPKPIPRQNLFQSDIIKYLMTLSYPVGVLDLDTCSNRWSVRSLLLRVPLVLGTEGILIINVRAGHDGDRIPLWWKEALGYEHQVVTSRPYYYYGSSTVQMRGVHIHYRRKRNGQ